jgi:putative membrane protein
MPFHGYSGYGVGWVGLVVGGLLMVLFWAGIIALIFFAIRAFTRGRDRRMEQEPRPREKETPLEILKRRYAQGEITREEYMDMKRDLES